MVGDALARSGRFVATWLAAATILLATSPAWAGGTSFTITEPALTSPHGLASDPSRSVYWTANQSGAGRVFAIKPDGSTAGVVTFPATTVAVEAVAYHENRVYLADIGNPDASRESVTIYRLGKLAYGGTSDVVAWEFTYPDGPHDAASMMVSPRGNLYVVTRGSTAAVYRAPSSLVIDGKNVLTRVATAPAWITDATFIDNQRMALRTYTGVLVMDAFSFETVGAATLPTQEAGESLTTSPDGLGLMAGSAVPASTVVAVPIPTTMASLSPAPSVAPTGASPTPSSSPSASEDAVATTEGGDGPSRNGTFLALGGALLLALVAAAVVAIKR